MPRTAARARTVNAGAKPDAPAIDPRTLKMPHTALEARMALEALTAADAANLLRDGREPWTRSVLRRGGLLRSLGMHAVDTGGWYWPVLFFRLTARGGATRVVSLAQAPRRDAEDQTKEPWAVRSFLRLENLGVFLGKKGEGGGLVNGDDA